MYINGHDNLYSDIFEYILPCGMQYQIIKKSKYKINKKEIICYIVNSLGPKIINNITNIDIKFDILYKKNIFHIIKVLNYNNYNINNYNLNPIEGVVIIYNNNPNINFIKYIHEIEHFDSHHEIYINIKNKNNKIILESLEIYIGTFLDIISDIYLKKFNHIK